MALSAYFDASGHPQDGTLLVVSGWLSFQGRWRQFEEEWAAALTEADVEYFHMKDFTQSRGQFEGWRGKDKKREKLLKRLIATIHRNLPEGFAGTVLLPDWALVNSRYMLAENKLTPYPLCGRSCVQQVYRWCDSYHYDRRQVTFVFERGDRDQGMLRDRLFQDFRIEIRFEDKKLPALQAADLAAWELRKALRQDKNNAPTRLRGSFVALAPTIESGGRHFSPAPPTNKLGFPRWLPSLSLEGLCADLSIPLR